MVCGMHRVKILQKKVIGTTIVSFTVEKPQGYHFVPGQATYVSLTPESWDLEKRPFSFASTQLDEHLEFIIKSYPEASGFTKKLSEREKGDAVCIGEAWGKLEYKGPGVFIAGGTGIVPFLSIMRAGIDRSTLLYSVQHENECIALDELKKIPHLTTNLFVTRMPDSFSKGRISVEELRPFIREGAHYYVCGPWSFIISVKQALDALGVPPERVIRES